MAPPPKDCGRSTASRTPNHRAPPAHAGVNPQRYLGGFQWDDTKWRIGELTEQLRGRTVLLGFDDLDVFKGIDLKLLAFERLLDIHEDWRGRLVLVQITSPPRSTSKEVQDMAEFIAATAERINKKYGNPRTGFMPLIYEERSVPLHDRLAYFALADVVVVTATRDGMNLVPYEYIVCRQGVPGLQQRTSMLVVSGAARLRPRRFAFRSGGSHSWRHAIVLNVCDFRQPGSETR
jgi:trehalose 6-phosphate synthase/phosphatase